MAGSRHHTFRFRTATHAYVIKVNYTRRGMGKVGPSRAVASTETDRATGVERDLSSEEAMAILRREKPSWKSEMRWPLSQQLSPVATQSTCPRQ